MKSSQNSKKSSLPGTECHERGISSCQTTKPSISRSPVSDSCQEVCISSALLPKWKSAQATEAFRLCGHSPNHPSLEMTFEYSVQDNACNLVKTSSPVLGIFVSHRTLPNCVLLKQQHATTIRTHAHTVLPTQEHLLLLCNTGALNPSMSP